MGNPPTTNRLLVAFDPLKPEKSSSDFLVPILDNGEFVLCGIKSKRNSAFGFVVFIGVRVTASDVFARLVDSGRKIPVVADTLNVLRSYIEQVSALKLGQVVKISGHASERDFSFENVKVTKNANRRPLP